MCTAVKYISNGFYFGRTLDNDCSYGEEVVILPRRFALSLRSGEASMRAHYAMIGVAHVADGMPLFYDAANEKGLAMAGLNFVGNAVYYPPRPDKLNIASFELIPWILGKCATVAEARKLLDGANVTDTRFNDKLPASELHWMIADENETVVLECTADGMHIYDDPACVLTNNPPFPQQLMNLNNYMHLSPHPPKNTFSDKLKFDAYSNGMGALGMPGDLSSESRFVRAAFTALNSPVCESCDSAVAQFFHILDAVAQPLGSCVMFSGKYETTVYSSCCNVTKGVFYYTTYENRAIVGVNMHAVSLDGKDIFRYPFVTDCKITMMN